MAVQRRSQQYSYPRTEPVARGNTATRCLGRTFVGRVNREERRDGFFDGGKQRPIASKPPRIRFVTRYSGGRDRGMTMDRSGGAGITNKPHSTRGTTRWLDPRSGETDPARPGVGVAPSLVAKSCAAQRGPVADYLPTTRTSKDKRRPAISVDCRGRERCYGQETGSSDRNRVARRRLRWVTVHTGLDVPAGHAGRDSFHRHVTGRSADRHRDGHCR